jgi:hypothetical protein
LVPFDRLHLIVRSAFASSQSATLPAEHLSFIQRDIPKWLKVARDAGISPQ